MTMGLLTNKWRILRKESLSFRMKKTVAILSVWARLHNFWLFMDDDKMKEHANRIEFLNALELVDPMLMEELVRYSRKTNDIPI